MSGIEIPDEPKGVGSIIRVVFKDPDARVGGTFYVGSFPGLWMEYGGEGVDEFNWKDLLQTIEFDEAEEFEVVYEGFGTIEADDTQHPKDWIWREGL